MDGLFCHVLVGTSQCLQSLVWMWISLTTEDGLNSLSNDSPGIIQIFLQLLLVEDELAQSLQGTLDSDDAMTERHTDITEHGTVSKVALQTAYRELLSQELKDGIGYTQVTLTVLVIDRVYLMYNIDENWVVS